jgi:periplasmic divalent cation tolerance protein
MNDSDISLVYVTVPDQATAVTIAEQVVALKLAACANIVGPTQSIFWWEEELQQTSEFIIYFKSRDALFERLRAAIVEIHPYSIPCVAAFPITMVHAPFLQWVLESTN